MIQIIAGTNRPQSNTRKIATLVHQLYQQHQVPASILDLADLPPSIFSPNSYATKPAEFQPMADAVVNSSGLVVITPEYNGGMPGVLKYFIDMLPFPQSFENKPVCFIGLAAGMWGALRPVEQLQHIFGYRNAYLFPQRIFIPKVTQILTEDGKISDDSISKLLATQAQGFAEFVKKIQG
jgi:NAD(P)H-dependent FMN reductase